MSGPYRTPTLRRHGLYDGQARDTVDVRLTKEDDVRSCILREWPDYVAEVPKFYGRKNRSGHPVLVAQLKLTEVGAEQGDQLLADIRRHVSERMPVTVEFSLEVLP